MSSVREVLDTQRQIEICLLSKMSNFEKQLQSSTSAADGNLSLERLSREFCEFKNLVWSILTMLRSLVNSLISKVDDLDNQNRRNVLLFNGVKECDGENCKNIILNIINTKMGLPDIQETALMSCHRLGTKGEKSNRPILVRFTLVTCRGLVWKEKKSLKSSPIVVSEFLTKTRQEIFATARKHFGMTRCWTQQGQIFVKLPDNECKRIISAEEIEVFIAKFPHPGTGYKPTTTSIKDPTPSRSAAGLSPASALAPDPPKMRRVNAAKNKPSK